MSHLENKLRTIKVRGLASILLALLLIWSLQPIRSPARAACPTTTRGMAVWSDGTKTPMYSIWDGSSFGRQHFASTMSDRWKIMQGAAAPSRDEKIVVGIANNKDVTGEIWNGSTWSPLPNPPGNPLGTVSENKWWGVEVAYEQQSGDAVLVWNNNPNLKFSVWNGSAWTTAATIAAYTGGEPQHMHLAADPNSDEMVLVVNDINAADYALVWDGSNWGNALLLDTSGNDEKDQTALDVAYEQQNGRAVVVYGKDGDANGYYRIWNGSGWDATEGTITAPGTISSQIRWMVLGSDPSSNRIALGIVTDGNATWLSMWDGSSLWGGTTVATTSAVGADHPNVAVAFQSQGTQALATYGRSGANSVFYRTWTSSGGWLGEQTGPDIGGKPRSMTLDTDLNSAGIMLSVLDDGRALNNLLWSGSTWGAPREQEDDTGENKNQPFVFLWNRNEGISSICTAALSPIQDNYLRQDALATNYGTASQLKVKPEITKENHAVLLFDLSGIPAGATIDSATLGLYAENSRDATQTITLYRLTESWTELGSTWNTRDGTAPWSTPGGTYDGTPLGSFQPTTTGWKTFNVAPVVQNWVDGTHANHGFILVATTTNQTGDVKFTSREGAAAQQPYLDIGYVENSSPIVDVVGIYETDHTTPVTALNPQTEYAVKVTVTDLDTLADLSTVRVTLFYDTDGDDDPADVPASGDTQNSAILTSTVGGTPVWSIEPSSASTWVLVASNSVQPSLTGTTGDFWFHFKPGKVATEAVDWDVYVVADDGGGTLGTLYDGSDYDMNWYGEITVNTASVDWGTVDLGTGFADNTNEVGNISVTYISNGSYEQQVRSDATWIGGSNSGTFDPTGTCDDPQEFSLLAYGADTFASAVQVDTSGVSIEATGTQTGESGNVVATNTLWLKVASVFAIDSYSGNTFFIISNR